MGGNCMELFLSLLGGVCWIIAYIQLIYVGFKDKTYGMPVFALALNFVWEALYSYITLKGDLLSMQGWIVLIWFLLDIGIVYTYLRYGRKEFPKDIDTKYFLPWTIIIFLMSGIFQYSFLLEFADLASWYSAFISNLIMSAAFINMLYIRKSTKGQNLCIAISKWIGTLAMTILFGIIYDNQLVFILGIFCSVFDNIYIYYLNITMKASDSVKQSRGCSKVDF